MSKRADERSAKFLADAIANWNVPPKIVVPMRGITFAERLSSRPNAPGTRVFSKMRRRATPFGATVEERRKLVRDLAR